MKTLQETLWREYSAEPNRDTPCLFIVGAPRTGSTIAYQYICQHTPAYIANVTNQHFPDSPAAGLCLQAAKGPVEVSEVSRFGHTIGLWQPSEATNVFGHWFSLNQPGQTRAANFVNNAARDDFLRTIDLMVKLFKRPPVFKNAWNCFRIGLLSKLLANSHWLWMRRDIANAATSDLYARYITKENPNVWNACEPSNVHALMARPYWEQVVENQFEYNTAIDDSLVDLPSHRKTVWWYEQTFNRNIPNTDLSEKDATAVRRYAADLRFKEMTRPLGESERPPVPSIVLERL